MDIRIPDGLGSLLRDFTVAVLVENPTNLLEFATEYFKRAKSEEKPNDIKIHHETNSVSAGEKCGSAGKVNVPMYIIVDDDDQAREPDPEDLKPKNPKNKFARRGSVSAERYDPEADDAAAEVKVIHEKSVIQHERLLEAVAGILLFRSLDTSQLNDVVDAMFERKVSPNEMVIRQGDDGDNFYVVDRGRFGILVGSGSDMKRVHQLDNSGSFGELALMYNMPRSASVVAETEGVLWAMDRQSFKAIVLRSAFKKRKFYEELLKEVPLLNALDEYERLNVADALISIVLKHNAVVINQGDEADGMYFVVEGTVSVRIAKEKGPLEVAQLHKGNYFGEVALIENKPRTATVVAISDVKLAFLERESFERLLGPCLDIMKRNSTGYEKQRGK